MSRGDGPRPLLIFPYNGNALEAADDLDERHALLGFVDDTPAKQGLNARGHHVGSRALFDTHPRAEVLAVVGSPTSFRQRRAVIEGLDIASTRWAQVVHPSARVSRHAVIGRNVLIMAGVFIGANAVVGDHVCVLPNSVIHHDARIGDWSLVGSNVTIAGHTTIGCNCYIGSGSSLINGISIGAGVLVGMASCVIRDVALGRRVVGNPQRELG